jgi:hypothetical protein
VYVACLPPFSLLPAPALCLRNTLFRYANQRAELLQHEQQQQALVQSRRSAHAAANGSNDIFGRQQNGEQLPLKMWQTRKKYVAFSGHNGFEVLVDGWCRYPELRLESKDR